MTTLGFGQKIGQIIQMAYVVENIEEAIDWWVNDARVGPWFLLESFTGEDPIDRGAQSRADARQKAVKAAAMLAVAGISSTNPGLGPPSR